MFQLFITVFLTLFLRRMNHNVYLLINLFENFEIQYSKAFLCLFKKIYPMYSFSNENTIHQKAHFSVNYASISVIFWQQYRFFLNDKIGNLKVSRYVGGNIVCFTVSIIYVYALFALLRQYKWVFFLSIQMF